MLYQTLRRFVIAFHRCAIPRSPPTSLIIVTLWNMCHNNLWKLFFQPSNFRFCPLILSQKTRCISSLHGSTEIIKSTEELQQPCLSNSHLQQAGTKLSSGFAEMLSCSVDQTFSNICSLDYHHTSACHKSCLGSASKLSQNTRE